MGAEKARRDARKRLEKVRSAIGIKTLAKLKNNESPHVICTLLKPIPIGFIKIDKAFGRCAAQPSQPTSPP